MVKLQKQKGNTMNKKRKPVSTLELSMPLFFLSFEVLFSYNLPSSMNAFVCMKGTVFKSPS